MPRSTVLSEPYIYIPGRKMDAAQQDVSYFMKFTDQHAKCDEMGSWLLLPSQTHYMHIIMVMLQCAMRVTSQLKQI